MSLTQQNIELWGDDIPWLAGLREKGLTAFKKLGFPKAKTEAWKYSYFNETALDGLTIDNKPHECACNGACHCSKVEKLPFSVINVSFCNGEPEVEHLELPKGLIIKSGHIYW